MNQIEKKVELNYKQMVKDIFKQVDGDFMLDMELKEIKIDKRPFTQKEASKMSNRLGQIYMIAHCSYCDACAGKYKLTKKK